MTTDRTFGCHGKTVGMQMLYVETTDREAETLCKTAETLCSSVETTER
jgi:hypothetical protein